MVEGRDYQAELNALQERIRERRRATEEMAYTSRFVDGCKHALADLLETD